MAVKKLHYVLTTIFVLLFLIGIVAAMMINTNTGSIKVQIITISDDVQNQNISGMLYMPDSATSITPQPGVVLTHGIGSNKEFMSGIALELARRGIISLAIDETGHGNTDSAYGSGADPTLGSLAAVRYLESLESVRESSIGLIGHSLGAGSARAATAAHGNITALVLIGGGFGEMVEDQAYGVFNSTFPKNLLVAIGKHDVLFELNQLKVDLIPVFGVSEPVTPGLQWGDFTQQNARKLVTPKTIHLAEAFDPLIVAESVQWMVDSLKPDQLANYNLQKNDLLYLLREGALLVSLLAFFGLIMVLSTIIPSILPLTFQTESPESHHGFLEDWKILASWGILVLVLFFPGMILGFIIPYPPLIFGGSLMWWFFMSALVGVLLLKILLPRIVTDNDIDIQKILRASFKRNEIIMAVSIIIIVYLFNFLLKSLTSLDLRVMSPIFGDLLPLPRFFIFLTIIPFLIVYFVVEGLFLHEFHDQSNVKDYKSNMADFLKVMGIKIMPFVLILAIQYIPLFLFNIAIFPSLVGFFLEFLWGIIPLLIISVLFSWWFYRQTGTIGMGTVFNALLIAWLLADTFPLGSFVM